MGVVHARRSFSFLFSVAVTARWACRPTSPIDEAGPTGASGSLLAEPRSDRGGREFLQLHDCAGVHNPPHYDLMSASGSFACPSQLTGGSSDAPPRAIVALESCRLHRTIPCSIAGRSDLAPPGCSPARRFCSSFCPRRCSCRPCLPPSAPRERDLPHNPLVFGRMTFSVLSPSVTGDFLLPSSPILPAQMGIGLIQLHAPCGLHEHVRRLTFGRYGGHRQKQAHAMNPPRNQRFTGAISSGDGMRVG